MTAREIGGDFEFEPPHGAQQRFPWETGRNAPTFVETGRQAISLISDALIHRGATRVIMAPPFCESMVSPWRLHVRFVDAITPNLLLRLGPHDAVFLQTLYGMPVRIAEDALEIARQRGVAVVIDFTHRPFDWEPNKADFSLASLRKLFPIPDGAVAIGVPEKLNLPSTEAPRDKVSAMWDKKRYLMHGGAKSHLDAFHQAEVKLGAERRPHAISKFSQRWLRQADLAGTASRRAGNARHLAAQLLSLDVAIVNPPEMAPVPSHLVIRHPDRDGLRHHLTASGIYCPVHWLRPEGWNRSWPDDYLSLPIDHRYDRTDMSRIATEIDTFQKKES